MIDHARETPHISPDVRSAGAGDSLVLLDLRSGKYLALSATAALIWRQLEAGRAPAQIAELVRDRYGIPAPRATADVEAMVEQLVGSGLVLREPPPAACEARPAAEIRPQERELADELFRVPDDGRRRAAGAADVGRALVALAAVDVLMRSRGLGRVRGLVASCRPRGRGGSPRCAAPLRVWATIRAVERAAALYVKQVWCLQSSAACAYLLRRQDVAAQMVLGVRPAPFYAHAWVEIGGRPVNETNQGLLDGLTVIDRW
jgi:hypothetical protein